MIYRIGNGLYELRTEIEASSDQEAWEIGRKLFNEGRGNPKGEYYVELDRRERLDDKRCSPKLQEQVKLIWDGRFLAWTAVFRGYTDEPWPDDIPSQLFP